MGMKVEDEGEAAKSTPKLSLSKVPYCKGRSETEPMQTPPLLPSVSIPFHWEEAPGKPKGGAPPPWPSPSPWPSSSSKSKAARSLELPPRLLHEHEHEHDDAKSPTTVLDGPYVGRSLSLACTFSFRKGPLAEAKRNLGSASFREETKPAPGGTIHFSHSLRDIFRTEDNVNNITRVRRRRIFSTINSKYLWGDIYASFKHAVALPWRRSSP